MGNRYVHIWAPISSGVLLVLSFPEFSLHFLAWVALVPYVYALARIPTWCRVIGAHFLFAGVYMGGVLYWIPWVLTGYGGFGSVAAAGVFLLMLALLTSLLLPFSLLMKLAARKGPGTALLAAPGFWALSELLRDSLPFGGFPWAALGYSQYPYRLIVQNADWLGVYGLSCLLVASSCAILYVLILKSWKYAVWFLVGFVLLNLYGLYRTELWEVEGDRAIQVALVQPGIELYRDREYYAREYFDTLPRYYRTAAEEGAQWVIFPEAPNPFLFGSDYYFTVFWEEIAADYRVPLVLNGTRRADGLEFNSAFLVNEEGSHVFSYDKVRLVPFGEYLPLGQVLGFADALVQEVGSYVPGERDQKLGSVDGVSWAVQICYEIIFPDLVRERAASGASVLVNLTNDSWFGRSAAASQHLQMAVFRAVESRKPLLRCANTGFSAIVDEKGGIVDGLGLFEKGLVRGRVAPNGYVSPYVRFGYVIPIFLIMLSLALLFFGGKGAKKGK